MIRPIDIRLNAAHPELPLVEATTFTGAPSSVFIRGVPRAVGNWSITAVNVAVTYPDNSTTTRAAVESAEGIWVATIPATATSGRTEAGFRVLADGIDENGAAVTGYVLGFADFSVMSFTAVPAPGETFYVLRYFDAIPTTPKKGDAAKVDGVLKFYNGTVWEPFADVDLSNYATKADATLGVSSWQYGPLTYSDQGGDAWYWTYESPTYSNGTWTTEITNGPDFITMTATGGANARSLTFTGSGEGVTASGTMTRGYQLGNDWVHILAAQSDLAATAALVAAKQDALSPQQLANIAAVPSKANTSDVNVALSQKQDRHTAWTVTKLAPYAPDATVEWVDGEWAFTSDGVVVTSTGNQNLAATRIEDLVGTYSATRSVIIDGKANRASPVTAGNLAALDANGNPTDAGWTAGDLARYALVTKTISNGAVTLDDRASNSVTISTTLSPNTLTINFPTAPTNKLRDFAMRLNIAAGVTAPEIAWPQGVTLENDGGEAPEIADGGTGGSSTILYFSETENDGTTAKFLVKGETLVAIAQA